MLLDESSTVTQPQPLREQSSHRRALLEMPGPDQMPVLAVRVSPTSAVPEIVGAVVEMKAGTELVGDEVAEADPALLVAVTCTASSCPRSASWGA